MKEKEKRNKAINKGKKKKKKTALMLTLIFIEFVGTTPLVINFLVLPHLPYFCKEKKFAELFGKSRR